MEVKQERRGEASKVKQSPFRKKHDLPRKIREKKNEGEANQIIYVAYEQ
jgi:hypothetical protein